MNLPDDIVQLIVADLKDRSGLGSEWELIDIDERYEIMSIWRSIVRDQIGNVIYEICPEE